MIDRSFLPPRPQPPDQDPRSAAVLREIVEQFVETGEPVGSRTLSRRLPMPLSPATIRSVMADLTDAGLLFAPHTSAGRLPTDRGLRLFVDGLLQFGDLSEEERDQIGRALEARGRSLQDTLADASSMLSGLSAAAGLVLAGDLGESEEHLRFVLDTLGPRFARLVWVPGNHELWTIGDSLLRGDAKYQQMVALCQSYGVLTPEDPYEIFDDGSQRYLVAPLFTLYDYTFCPPGMTVTEALAWALEAGLQCADEHLLHPDPYPSREAWC